MSGKLPVDIVKCRSDKSNRINLNALHVNDPYSGMYTIIIQESVGINVLCFHCLEKLTDFNVVDIGLREQGGRGRGSGFRFAVCTSRRLRLWPRGRRGLHRRLCRELTAVIVQYKQY